MDIDPKQIVQTVADQQASAASADAMDEDEPRITAEVEDSSDIKFQPAKPGKLAVRVLFSHNITTAKFFYW